MRRQEAGVGMKFTGKERVVGLHDCIEVTNIALGRIGIGRGAHNFDVPRMMVWFYSLFANMTYSGDTGETKKREGRKPDAHSTITYCTDGINPDGTGR